jgi:gluconate 2-dehydrogenase gamma chain
LAGQGPSRRELLQALTLASAASVFPGFARWSYGLGEATAQSTVNPVYRPQFFSAGEYATVELLADLILPATEDAEKKRLPGAKEAGVAEFIDFMVFSDRQQQAPFRDGLHRLDHAGSASFVTLPAAKQNALLERLAYKAKHRPQEKQEQAFFLLFRRYTVMGFYTTRVGLESLDFPGFTFYSTSPGCTHHDNREHVGLEGA